ncbi:MAG: hypothetical protein K6G84_15545 [Lachnospiraceae bacterium]|nr:hypothetical protein [Lachnospiraceae bacterium]
MLGDINGRVYVYDISVEITSGTYLSREALNIQHGDEANNNSKINLPNLNAMFDIYTKYGYSSIEDSLTLEEYYPETTTTQTTGGTYSSYTETIPGYTYQQANYTTKPPRVYYEAGEGKTEYFPPTISGYTTVTVPEKTVTRYTYTGGTSTKITTPEHYGELNFPILSVISDLINCVSKMRSDLGASQNRLEHAFRFNENANENLQQAESKLRDTDMAAEMVVFSKNKILQQAGQSMLTNSNNNAQNVLNLLQ